MVNKTQLEVLIEYANRQKNPEYMYIEVLENTGKSSQYTDVCNIKKTQDEMGNWLEFDYESYSHNSMIHVKLQGHIITTFTKIND